MGTGEGLRVQSLVSFRVQVFLKFRDIRVFGFEGFSEIVKFILPFTFWYSWPVHAVAVHSSDLCSDRLVTWLLTQSSASVYYRGLGTDCYDYVTLLRL